MKLVLVTGLSGSGKSVALHVLEDSGYYCVDNLPVTLLPEAAQALREAGNQSVAVSIDARSGSAIALVTGHLEALRSAGIDVRTLYLDAQNATLIKRFSETRRRHPLARGDITLDECLARERELLAPVAGIGHRIDTSELHPNTLRNWVRDVLQVQSGRTVLLFESFGYKEGIPLDADLVFDVRCLTNPYYDPILRPLTGLDAEVVAYLEKDSEVARMLADIRAFLDAWVPSYARENRSFLTTAIGCTGGRHRWVYCVERRAAHFRDSASVVVRHRQLPG